MEPYVIEHKSHEDNRGVFIKLFSQLCIEDTKIEFVESYVSSSHKGVWRGLHFQRPPMDHFKLVTLISGKIDDYIVNINKHSDLYKKIYNFSLSNSNQSILIPPGHAHGFKALEKSVVLYHVTTRYSPEYDDGLSYKYLSNIQNQDPNLISKRDKQFSSNIDEIAI